MKYLFSMDYCFVKASKGYKNLFFCIQIILLIFDMCKIHFYEELSVRILILRWNYSFEKITTSQVLTLFSIFLVLHSLSYRLYCWFLRNL